MSLQILKVLFPGNGYRIDRIIEAVDAFYMNKAEALESSLLVQRGVYGYYTSGSYYHPVSTGSTLTGILGQGTFRGMAVFIPSTVVISRLFAEVTTVGSAGALVRLVILNRTGELTGSLLLDAGTIDGTVLGMQELTVNATLTRGWYWFGAIGQGAPTTQATVRCCSLAGSSPIVPLGTSLPATNSQLSSVIATGITGAAPSTLTFTTSGAVAPPRLGLKVT